jgi:hypothetical protein
MQADKRREDAAICVEPSNEQRFALAVSPKENKEQRN